MNEQDELTNATPSDLDFLGLRLGLTQIELDALLNADARNTIAPLKAVGTPAKLGRPRVHISLKEARRVAAVRFRVRKKKRAKPEPPCEEMESWGRAHQRKLQAKHF